jgi:ribose transport system substrate-binding protein
MEYGSTRRALLRASGLGAAGLLGTGLLGRGVLAQDKKFKIALSNSFIGNKWRLEMENVFKASLLMEPYKSTVEGSWFNSGNDVSKQSQQLSNLIAERVDAILIDAASPTGLNGIIGQAAARGILVIAFDSTVTTTKALKVNVSQHDLGKTLAEFLAKKLNGKGNVIMVTGVAGTQVDEDRNKGADEVWAANPGIKVVNRYTGMWDSSVAERNTAAVLSSLPQIDGIWCQGGTDGVLKAFISANRKLPFTAGECENGFRRFMSAEGYMGHKVEGISIGSPPFLSAISLELACQILSGKRPKKDIDLPLAITTNDTVKVGETVFPDQPDSFFDDFTDGGPHPLIKICVDAALSGKSCGTSLAINLPAA